MNNLPQKLVIRKIDCRYYDLGIDSSIVNFLLYFMSRCFDTKLLNIDKGYRHRNIIEINANKMVENDGIQYRSITII